MKAFVAALSSLAAAASGNIIHPGLAPYTYAHAPVTIAGAAPVLGAVPAFAPAALAYGSPYDYAGQVYPLAEPYIHQEVPAEAYAHQEIAAEPYVHQEVAAEEYAHEEVAAEPYVHEEVAAEPYVHDEVAAEPYVHAEIAAEPYIHQEPVAVVAAPAPVAVAAAPYAFAPAAFGYAAAPAYPHNFAGYPYAIPTVVKA